jgi:hypothetical protein
LFFSSCRTASPAAIGAFIVNLVYMLIVSFFFSFGCLLLLLLLPYSVPTFSVPIRRGAVGLAFYALLFPAFPGFIRPTTFHAARKSAVTAILALAFARNTRRACCVLLRQAGRFRFLNGGVIIRKVLVAWALVQWRSTSLFFAFFWWH